jgi:hypothetical protein
MHYKKRQTKAKKEGIQPRYFDILHNNLVIQLLNCKLLEAKVLHYMNYATALELPTSWETDAQPYSYRAVHYTSFAFKAFNQEIAPVLGEALKDQPRYYVQCLKGANRWAVKVSGITHNSIQVAVRAAHAELTSTEAQATYHRIGHITRETAMDALVVAFSG